MRRLGQITIAVAVFACLAVMIWVARGQNTDDAVERSNVAGGIAAVAALALAVAGLWPRIVRRSPAPGVVSVEQADAAVEYLATQTLRYWQDQAAARRITTPSPSAVRWHWADPAMAIPAADLHSNGYEKPLLGQGHRRVLTAGIVTELREQLYERLDPDRPRIVILGGPGAGKTAALLLLLIDILTHRDPETGAPVPVWLTLSGWDPATPLLDYATATLVRDFPGLLAPEHGGPNSPAHLLRTGQLALFLDGLDELGEQVRGQALQCIDQETAGMPVVVTSRTSEFRDALKQGRLYRAAVVELLPVAVKQATAFLLAEQLGARRQFWQHVTRYLSSHPDSVAAQTLTTPLAISLARDVYATSGDPSDLLDECTYPDPQALLQHLLTRFLTIAYPRHQDHDHAIHILSWVAQHMGTNRDLRWWDIPTWTPAWQRHLRWIAVWLVGGIAVGLGGGLANGLVKGFWEGGVAFGFLFGLVGGLAVGLMSRLIGRSGSLEPQRMHVRWPTRNEVFRTLVFGLVGGLAVGLAGGLVFWLVFEPSVALSGGLGFGLVGGLVFGLANGLAESWTTTAPVTGAVTALCLYRDDRRRTLVVGLTTGLTVGLVFGFLFGLTVRLASGLSIGFTAGLTAGLVSGLVSGNRSTVELAVVELIWLARGKRMRFLSVLETALQRQVLRQVGGIYQFRHAALQDLLANAALQRSPTTGDDAVVVDVRSSHPALQQENEGPQ